MKSQFLIFFFYKIILWSLSLMLGRGRSWVWIPPPSGLQPSTISVSSFSPRQPMDPPFWSHLSPSIFRSLPPVCFLPPFSGPALTSILCRLAYTLLVLFPPPHVASSTPRVLPLRSRPSLSSVPPPPAPPGARRRHAGRGGAPVEGRVPPLELLHGALEEPVRPLQQAGSLLRPVTPGGPQLYILFIEGQGCNR